VTAVARLEHVGKAFGAHTALDDVTLEVRTGEVLAVLGPNGAGKTTAVSLLVGLRRPDTGRAVLFGRDPRGPAARTAVGVTPQEAGFPPTLRVGELVDLVRGHYALPARRSDLLERFGLAALERRQAGGLSGGEKRRLAVALAFAGAPRAVFLDEPTTGLDVDARQTLWEAIHGYAHAGGSVLLTTHYLDEAQALAARAVVLDTGRVVAEGTPSELARRLALTRVRVPGRLDRQLAGAERVEQGATHATVYTRDADATVRALVSSGVSLDGVEVLPASLEDAFLALTRTRE
jgi:ABC-2 type transport system ATP-binding protein